jgi:hypothetical protein
MIQHFLCRFESGNILSLCYRIRHSNLFRTILTYRATILCVTQNPQIKSKIAWRNDEDYIDVTFYNELSMISACEKTCHQCYSSTQWPFFTVVPWSVLLITLVSILATPWEYQTYMVVLHTMEYKINPNTRVCGISIMYFAHQCFGTPSLAKLFPCDFGKNHSLAF